MIGAVVVRLTGCEHHDGERARVHDDTRCSRHPRAPADPRGRARVGRSAHGAPLQGTHGRDQRRANDCTAATGGPNEDGSRGSVGLRGKPANGAARIPGYELEESSRCSSCSRGARSPEITSARHGSAATGRRSDSAQIGDPAMATKITTRLREPIGQTRSRVNQAIQSRALQPMGPQRTAPPSNWATLEPRPDRRDRRLVVVGKGAVRRSSRRSSRRAMTWWAAARTAARQVA